MDECEEKEEGCLQDKSRSCRATCRAKWSAVALQAGQNEQAKSVTQAEAGTHTEQG